MRCAAWILIGVMIALKSFPLSASTMTATQNLSFGTWVPTGSTGSIMVSNSGTTTNSGVTTAPSGTGAFQAILKFTGTGLGALLDVITITPLSSSVTLSNGSGGTVTVGSFTPQTGLGVTLLSPTINIPMGGTLTFSSLPVGTYNGSVQVQGTGLLSGTATATVPISVTFWRVLTLNQVTPLNFGTIELRGGNATVRVSTSGTRTIVSGGGGSVNLVPSPAPTAGQFSVTGQKNANVTVTLPSTATLTGSSGGTMTVSNFTKSPSTTNLGGGSLNLNVGADLSIASNQKTGVYTGTYQMTVNY